MMQKFIIRQPLLSKDYSRILKGSSAFLIGQIFLAAYAFEKLSTNNRTTFVSVLIQPIHLIVNTLG